MRILVTAILLFAWISVGCAGSGPNWAAARLCEVEGERFPDPGRYCGTTEPIDWRAMCADASALDGLDAEMRGHVQTICDVVQG